MNINEAIYGSPDIWQNSWVTSSFTEDYAVKRVNYKNNEDPATTLENGVLAGKLSYSIPMDKSISYCGLGEASPFNTIGYFTGDTTENEEPAYRDNRDITNFVFADVDSTTSRTQNYQLGNNYINTFWTENMNFQQNVNPYLRFWAKIPMTTVWCIKVSLVQKPAPGDNNLRGREYWLDEVTDSVLETYGYLHWARIYPYFQNSSDSLVRTNPQRLTGTSAILLSILDELNIPQFNIANKYIYSLFQRYVYQNYIHIWGTTSYIYKNYTDGFDIILGDVSERFELGNGIGYNYLTQFTAELKEKLMKATACFGMYFTGSETTARTGKLDDPNMFLGILENGIGNGKYTKGEGNRDQPQWNWKDTTESDYDYTKEQDTNHYEDSTSLPAIPSYESSYNVYQDNFARLTDQALIPRILKSIATVTIVPEYPGITPYYGQEPIQCIVGARRIFFNPPPYGLSENVMLGHNKLDVSAHKLGSEWSRYDLGSATIFRHFGNFLDFEPYTTVSLYVPYCGSMKLPTAVFMGHSCRIIININNRLGMLHAIIYVDNIEYATMEGECGCDIGISGLANSQYYTRLKELQSQLTQSRTELMTTFLGHAAGASISAALGNPAGALVQTGMAFSGLATQASRSAQIKFELEHTQPTPLLIQKAVSEINAINCLQPFILLQRPVYEDGFDADTFGKNVGFQCYRIGNKSEFSGYTECINANLNGISCTLAEKNMILDALQEGVYL